MHSLPSDLLTLRTRLGEFRAVDPTLPLFLMRKWVG